MGVRRAVNLPCFGPVWGSVCWGLGQLALGMLLGVRGRRLIGNRGDDQWAHGHIWDIVLNLVLLVESDPFGEVPRHRGLALPAEALGDAALVFEKELLRPVTRNHLFSHRYML